MYYGKEMGTRDDRSMLHPKVAIDAAIPTGLATALAQQKLVTNRDSHEEWQDVATSLTLPEPRRKLFLIREFLLTLPLVHTTKVELPDDAGILPDKYLGSDKRSNTYDFDRSLGLDSYVFFHWGLPDPGYGDKCVFVHADALRRPDTIVTPIDIARVATMSGSSFFDEDAAERAEFGKRYFDKMLTGEDWLTLTALKILRCIEQGCHFYHLLTPDSLGEIKICLPVDSHLILDKKNIADLTDYYKWLLNHGFSVEGKIPKDYGVDIDQACHFWHDLLKSE